MSKTTDKEYAAILLATQHLRAKAGTGVIPSAVIKKCQAILDNNTYDFTPIGQGILDRIQTILEKTRNGTLSRDHAHHKILECIMQLKANGSMFGYNLVTALCSTVMALLETIDTLDDDTLEIITSLYKALSIIFEEQLKNDGGRAGKLIEKEINTSCKRYYKKRQL